MARRYSDIPQGRGDTPDALYWSPSAPDFLDRRETRQQTSTSTVLPYEVARRKAQEASAKREEERRKSRGGASIIDFGSLEAARMHEERQYGVGDYFEAAPRNKRPQLWDEDYSYQPQRESRSAQPAPRRSSDASRSRRSDYPDDNWDRASYSRRERGGYRASDGYGTAQRYRSQDSYGTTRRREPASAPSWVDDAYWENGRYRGNDRFDDARFNRDDWDEREQEAPRNPLQKLRHDYRQWKADRRFNRDYADAPSASEGPRAALYKGQMGHVHQRAARMQEAASGVRRGASGGYAHSAAFERFTINRHFAVVASVLLCLVVSFALIYPDAQDYYLKIRETDRAAAEYQAVLDRNQELTNHVAALQTDEGMEELAHESLGWVRDDENSVSVIREGSSRPTTDAEGQSGAVLSGSVPAPETWYSPVLDVVFGYEG